MSEKKKDELTIIPSTSLVKISRSLQITGKIIEKSYMRQFELERAHFDSVVIGNQDWMTKNLNVAYFRNGDPIPEIRDHKEWARAGREGKPAWCYYDNNPENGKVYGKLYNWYAVNDTRGLAPNGWKIPDYDKDFSTLLRTLGENAGKKLKSITVPSEVLLFEEELKKKKNTADEEKPNDVPKPKWSQKRDRILYFKRGTNESGFNALLGGLRLSFWPVTDTSSRVRYFQEIEHGSSFWGSATLPDDDMYALVMSVYASMDSVPVKYDLKYYGHAVRCIRQNEND